MSRSERKRKLSRWNRDPHCFWCGVETIWHESNGDTPPERSCTLDHIRSRFHANRKPQPDKPWTHGIWVLACWKCNNERGQMEQAWLAANRPDVLHAKCGSPPANKSLLTAQGIACAALRAFVGHGGTLVGREKDVKRLRRALRDLEREYAATRRIKEPTDG